MASWDSYRRLFFYSIHLIFYFLLRCVQSIYWNLNGVQNHINKCKKGENYESSAQLLKVWSWSEGRIFHIQKRRNFLSTHVRCVHPEYALQKHITLMTVTDKEAIFSIPSPDEDVLDSRRWPFLFLAQGVTAKYILIMPTSSLIKLADSMSNPTTKIIWIHFTARCGSTAVIQAFNSLPDAIGISEPMCTFSLNQAFRWKNFGNWEFDWTNSREYLQIYRSTVRLLLKPYLKNAKIVVMKSHTYMSKKDIDLIPKLFPEFIEIFMYRNARDVVLSMQRVLHDMDPHEGFTYQIATNRWLSKLLPSIKPLNLKHKCCDTPEHVQWLFSDENLSNCTEFVSIIIHFAETCFHSRAALMSSAKSIPAFKYEHLLSDQTKFLKTLFHHSGLELTEERMALIQAALREDSQKGSVLDKEKVGKGIDNLTADMIEQANKVLTYYKLPEWGEPLTLPNTVSSY